MIAWDTIPKTSAPNRPSNAANPVNTGRSTTPTAATVRTKTSTANGPEACLPGRMYNVAPRAMYETSNERRRLRNRRPVGRQAQTPSQLNPKR
jgi:hypothetical protein